MVKGLSDAELLVKYGFLQDEHESKYKYDEDKQHYVPKNEDAGYNGDHADQEVDEEANISQNKQYFPTEFPKPTKRYRMLYESFNMSMESMYYWTLNHLREDMAFPHIHKITDMFSASENSAFFGQQAQRKSIQEDRATGYLKGISDLVKTLFQIVRELRVIDERLEIYEKSGESKTADTTLKGIYVDFAENKGGQTQPGSVYQLANQVGYAILPDLFFNTWVLDKQKIDEEVESSSFNETNKNLVKRKLYQYLTWREKTWEELEQRRKFQIKYLRQHYTVIKQYIGWVKPYLKHIRRLQMNEDELDSPDLITSFETSSSEIEILGVKPNPGNKLNSVVLMYYKYNTRPVMQYQQERNQGPSHVGKCVMTLRSYAWTDREVQMYRAMKEDQELELLGMVDDQLGSAMDMLGDDLDKYIREAEGTLEENQGDKSDAPKKNSNLKPIGGAMNVLDPFTAVFKGFKDIGSALTPDLNMFSSNQAEGGPPKKFKEANKAATFAMRMVYMNYKRAHGLIVTRR